MAPKLSVYKNYWTTISNGILGILNGKTDLSFEELYRSAYYIVANLKMSHKLINDVEELLRHNKGQLTQYKVDCINDFLLYLCRTQNYTVILGDYEDKVNELNNYDEINEIIKIEI